jgi:sensor c-di-GMP phosphodiesterase-like protein
LERKSAIRIAMAVAFAAVVLPLAFSIYFVRQNAMAGQFDQLSSYARDVLNRTDGTGAQVGAGFRRLEAAHAEVPCGAGELALMRQIAIGSSYVQAIGRVENNALVCSSLGIHQPPLPLGPPDVVTPRKAAIRVDVRLPFAPDASFLALETRGFGAIIHKSLPIDATTNEPDVTLASFTRAGPRLLTSRGHVDPAWLAHPRVNGAARFVDKGYIVVVVDSKRYYTAALAAVPMRNLDRRLRSMALLLLPVGAIAGIALALAVGYLARTQMAMPALLRTALRRDELFVAYQPIVDLQTGRWVGAEALVRWRRANGELVRPDLFIPMAEDANLVHFVTERVIELVTLDIAQLVARKLDIYISVNLAPADLHSPDTLPLLLKALGNAGAEPARLHVEATERGFIHTDSARQLIEDIRAAGIAVAIDDFGTGYSSLALLESFRLDYLKIDKAFVDSVGAGAATSQVVPHIIEMAKSLELTMIAEGVEREEQAQFLREHGVQFAQGWLFAPALPFDALLEGLAKSRAP